MYLGVIFSVLSRHAIVPSKSLADPKVGVPVALDTAPYLKDENRSFSEVATRDFLGSRADPCLKIQMYYMVLWVGADLCPVAY